MSLPEHEIPFAPTLPPPLVFVSAGKFAAEHEEGAEPLATDAEGGGVTDCRDIPARRPRSA